MPILLFVDLNYCVWSFTFSLKFSFWYFITVVSGINTFSQFFLVEVHFAFIFWRILLDIGFLIDIGFFFWAFWMCYFLLFLMKNPLLILLKISCFSLSNTSDLGAQADRWRFGTPLISVFQGEPVNGSWAEEGSPQLPSHTCWYLTLTSDIWWGWVVRNADLLLLPVSYCSLQLRVGRRGPSVFGCIYSACSFLPLG